MIKSAISIGLAVSPAMLTTFLQGPYRHWFQWHQLTPPPPTVTTSNGLASMPAGALAPGSWVSMSGGVPGAAVLAS